MRVEAAATAWLALACAAWAGDAGSPRRFGLVDADGLDAAKPVVLLVHGLNSDHTSWSDMATLLKAEGHQVAYFDYPNDQSIGQSSQLLSAALRTLAAGRGEPAVDVVTHSMGALVARHCVEGEGYPGGVRRLIMLAPPNHGSKCARLAFCTEYAEHARLALTHRDWSWSWIDADGHGEAGHEIRPDSEFLAKLNALPRRDGVRYSIIAGDHNVACRYGANVLQFASERIGDESGYAQAAQRGSAWAVAALKSYRGSSDGMIKIDSARLPGVDDVLVVDADHTTIFRAREGQPPAAWEAVRSRLAK